MAKSNVLLRAKLKKVKQLLGAGNTHEAEQLLNQLVRKAPRQPEIWMYKGYIAGISNNHAEAAECFAKALAISPKDPSILYNYGIALRDKGDFKAAISAFEKSLRGNPDNTEVLNCLAHACMSLSDFGKAEETYLKSLGINHNQPETHSNLGRVYQSKGELSKAEQSYRTALGINPKLNIFDNLGSTLVSQGRYEEAIEIYRKGLEQQPDNPKVFSNLLLSLNYMEGINQHDVFEEHKKFGNVFENTWAGPVACSRHSPKEIINIGYYSPDFREHSVAYFIEPIIRNHDAGRFKTFAYFPSDHGDAVTERFRQSFGEWRNVSGMSPAELAAKIREDDIDILVDLAGHTGNNALPAFALQPSPVQVTWLGYPNTTGLRSIGFRITDAVADPEGQEQYYTEQLRRLDGCFLTYLPEEDSPNVMPAPCRTNGYITYGSFNNLAKMNDHVIAVWCDLLKQKPDARLFIKNPSLTDETTRQRYLGKFAQGGISEDRIDLVGHTPTRREHLELYGKIDVALDTFPYNGTTTTCEALWMGLPVITLCGDHHAARVGASLLNAVEKAEWITSTDEEYVSKAIEIAGDPEQLDAGRSRQRDSLKHSRLLDHQGFVSSLEAEYLEIIEPAG